MIVLEIFGAIAVVAVGVTVADLFRKRKPRRGIDARAIDIAEARTFHDGFGSTQTGVYFPPPDDGRPR